MFKKTQRLSKPEFDVVFRSGKRHHSPVFTIITKPSDTTKVSVVVGKKVAKSAVRRNTLRRRIYALLREVVPQTKQTYIVIAKPKLNTLSRKQAQQVFMEAIAEVSKKT